MRRLILVLLVLCAPAFARQRIFGFCEAGNATVTIGGLTSATTYQGSYPSATVSVFATGTTNLSTIYSDNIGTVKANPFTLTPGDGYWFAYTDNGRYDVKCSGTGIASPFTRGDYLANDPSIALAFTAVAFSATPVFASVSGTVYTMTLTGNVTSSTITGSMTGQIIYFQLCQDGAGSRTFAWPATFLRPPTISSAASSCTNSSFFYDGVNWRQLAATGDSLAAPSGITTTTLTASGAIAGASIASSGALSGTAISGTSAALTAGVTSATNTVTNAGVFTNSQMNEYAQSLIHSISPATEYHTVNANSGINTTAGLAAGVAVPVGSTVFQADGIEGFISCGTATVFCVGGYFSARPTVNNAIVWGINPVATDVGFTGTTVVGEEVDTNATSTTTVVENIQVNGSFTAQPTTAIGVRITKPQGTGVWTVPFNSDDGASSGIGLQLGATGVGAGTVSQSIQLVPRDGSNVPHTAIIRADTNGAIQLTPPAGQGVAIQATTPLAAPRGIMEVVAGDNAPDALNANLSKGSNITDGGNIGLSAGVSSTGNIRAWLQARNNLGANNTAYPIALNPLGGNVGIGQSNPATTLDVNGTGHFATSIQLDGGVANDRSGFKHKRVTTGSCNNATRCSTTVTWGTTFADANYTATCSINDTVYAAGAAGFLLERYSGKIGASLVVTYLNQGATPGTTELDCIAVHD